MLTWEDVIKVGSSYQRIANGLDSLDTQEKIEDKMNNMTNEEFYNEYPDLTPEKLKEIQENIIKNIHGIKHI